MLRDPTEVAEGDTVHLYPQTKQASSNCHKMLAVKIMKNPKTHWPMVAVCWDVPGGPTCWELVHKDNIRKKPSATVSTSAEKKAGDTVGDGGSMSKWKPKVMPGARKYEVDMPDDMEQGTLW